MPEPEPLILHVFRRGDAVAFAACDAHGAPSSMWAPARSDRLAWPECRDKDPWPVVVLIVSMLEGQTVRLMHGGSMLIDFANLQRRADFIDVADLANLLRYSEIDGFAAVEHPLLRQRARALLSMCVRQKSTAERTH